MVGLAPRSRDEKHPSEQHQLELNKLQSVSGQSDLKLPSPKHTQSHSQSRKDHCQKGNEEKRDARPDKREQTDESNRADNVCPKSVISYKEYKAQKEVEQGALAADKSPQRRKRIGMQNLPSHLRTLPQGPAL